MVALIYSLLDSRHIVERKNIAKIWIIVIIVFNLKIKAKWFFAHLLGIRDI